MFQYPSIELAGGRMNGESTDSAVPASPHRIRVDVILGMPKHDCRFHGICKIDEEGKNNSPYLGPGDFISGWLIPYNESCCLLLEGSQLSATREAYHFDRDCITLSAPVQIGHLPISDYCGENYLLPGDYPLHHVPPYYLTQIAVRKTDLV
ncbi:hypothetical protein [Lewinella sp. W8]|uniref:hypothetical protein n=1 Tax=Lewinella sp. W8 TaxID=2528208 RepID=UPI001068AC83|nr:hypothetical protein [Lewinella sp. W8]MTB50744.1 hypothetical protein [Lewinella sp. W8]